MTGRVALSRPGAQSVVPIYQNAGERWRAGADVYAPAWPLDVFRYPPPTAAAFAPLSHLPPKPAGILWRLAGLAAFAFGLRAFVAATLPGLSRVRLGLLAAVAAELALPSVNNGQVNVHLAGALLIGAAAAATGRFWAAAAWLALAAWMKGFPLAVGMLVVVAVPPVGWRLAVMMTIGFAAAFVGSDAGYVWDEYRRFVGYLGADDRTLAPLDRASRDWRIVPRAWLGVIIPAEVGSLVSMAAGLVFAAVTWRRGLGIGVALGGIWMTLFGPATEGHTYTLLAPVAAIAVATARRPAGVAVSWAAYLLLLAPVVRATFPASDVLPLRTAQPVGATVLLVACLRPAGWCLRWPVVVSPTRERGADDERLRAPLARASG